jgi:hypothetical protein
MMKKLLIIISLLICCTAWAIPPIPPVNQANVAITGGTINGTPIGATTPAAGTFTNLTGTVSDYDTFTIDALIDGAAAPSVAEILSSTNKTIIREFVATADKDGFINWTPPPDWNAGTITFKVGGWVKNATAPATGETVIFALKGASIGVSELLSSALGDIANATFTAPATMAQYDRWETAWSGAVTLAGATAGETVILNLSRDVDDTYAQPIGVSAIQIKYTRTLAP